uniref:Uncharacterized protein n=1 Tax=Oryza sativa subsp. japonica TaxID=39947 RepID=Q7XIA4_ORYSJ|nr:hypothetical protein [Oryza sativa Japonica Group]BAD30483.1 hypothetical protein [Oryza sativa Japonica Group]
MGVGGGVRGRVAPTRVLEEVGYADESAAPSSSAALHQWQSAGRMRRRAQLHRSTTKPPHAPFVKGWARREPAHGENYPSLDH